MITAFKHKEPEQKKMLKLAKERKMMRDGKPNKSQLLRALVNEAYAKR